MSEIRIQKTTEIIVDDFTVSDESKLTGVLTFIDEHDDTNDLIYVHLGNKQIGWIPKRCLIDLAQVLIKEFSLTSCAQTVNKEEK